MDEILLALIFKATKFGWIYLLMFQATVQVHFVYRLPGRTILVHQHQSQVEKFLPIIF